MFVYLLYKNVIIRIRTHNSIDLHELFQITRTKNEKVDSKAAFTKPFLSNGYEISKFVIKM